MEQIDPDIRELKGYGIAMAALLMFFISFPTVLAQESINAAGGNAMGSGGSVSFSIGQLVNQTHTESYGSVAEGVQQPYEISIVTETEDAMGVNLLLGVYPNPTQDYLVLNTDNVDFSILDFQLYNMQGKLLLSERIARTQTIIPMSDLVPAIYFLKVVQGRNEIKTFKVIKN